MSATIRFGRALTPTLLGIALLAGGTPRAAADFLINVKATNNTGVTVSDLHMTFINTGGSINNEAIVANDPGAGAATIGVQGGNTIVIDWGAANYFPNAAQIEYRFLVNFGNIQFNSGTWTRTALGLPDIAFDSTRDFLDVTITQVPEPTALALAGLGVVVLVGLRRRAGRRA